LETSFAIWRRAGELSLALRRRGITVPLSDLVVAGLALEHGCAIYTLDSHSHFDRIPDLPLHRVGRSPRRR
jgi:predicted nucleic acid-binding protein